MRRCMLLLIVVVAVFATGPPGWAQGKVAFKNRAIIYSEYDDNVYKSPEDPEGDFLGRLYYDMRLHLYPNRDNTIALNYQGGAKKYIEFDDQDTLVNLIRLSYTNTDIRNTFLGVEGSMKFRNIRSGEEDYNKLITEAYAGYHFGQETVLQVRGGYTRFDFASYNFYDYWLQRYGILLQKGFGPSYSFGFNYFFQEKNFPFPAFVNAGTESGAVFLKEGDRNRRDVLHEPSVYFRMVRWLLVDVSYLLQINQSNSYGDSYYNHRFSLGLAKNLFKNTNVHVIGVAQIRDSYQEVLIPHSYSIEEDDENYNSVRAKVSHKFTDWFSLEVGYSRYWTTYSSRDLNFIKNNYSIGAGFTF